jgi:phage FluMu protein gp41
MSKDKQQTAVELFIKQLEEKGDIRETPSIRNIQLNIDTADYIELKIKAKEMFEEQIKNAFARGNCFYGYETNETMQKNYYQKTYGGGKL